MEFDLKTIFLHELDSRAVAAIALRTFVMFALILAFLRLSGKKGVQELSIFEVAIVIGLGSAAGDPMINEDKAILPTVVVFLTILAFYRFITWAMARSERFESLLEGDPVYVIEDGRFVLAKNGGQPYPKDEFFAEMRQQNIVHLGQLRAAVLETNGAVSFFYYEDSQTRPGLPVLPRPYRQRSRAVPTAGHYACTCCGSVERLATAAARCPRCDGDEWVAAIDAVRRP